MANRKGFLSITVATLALLFLAGNFVGCETEDWIMDVNCGDCDYYRPDTAALIVHLTINAENPAVPLTFYSGEIDWDADGEIDGEIDWLDTATTPEHYLDARIGTEYTVMAEYRSGTKHVIAFDADKMSLLDKGEECGDPCYIVKGGIFDLELRETP